MHKVLFWWVWPIVNIFLARKLLRDFPGGSLIKSLPMQETWVWFLGLEDSLEKEMATHSSILVWEIPWTEEPSRLQSMGSQRGGHDWATNTFTFFIFKDVVMVLDVQQSEPFVCTHMSIFSQKIFPFRLLHTLD